MRKFAAIAALSMLVASCGDKPETAAPAGEPPAGEQAAAAGGAGDVQEHRPGLWENVVDDGSSVDTIRECRLEQSKEARAFLDEPAKEGCTKTQNAIRGGVSVKMVCPNEMISQIEFTATGNATNKQMLTTMTVNGETVTARSNSRWIGPCPDGMRDGDLVQDGE